MRGSKSKLLLTVLVLTLAGSGLSNIVTQVLEIRGLLPGPAIDRATTVESDFFAILVSFAKDIQ